MTEPTVRVTVTHRAFRNTRSGDGPYNTVEYQKGGDRVQRITLDANGKRTFTCDTCGMALYVQRDSNPAYAAAQAKRRRKGLRHTAWGLVLLPLGTAGSTTPSVWGTWAIALAIPSGLVALGAFIMLCSGLLHMITRPQRITIREDSPPQRLQPQKGWYFTHHIHPKR